MLVVVYFEHVKEKRDEMKRKSLSTVLRGHAQVKTKHEKKTKKKVYGIIIIV